jgi:hypothetical protein
MTYWFSCTGPLPTLTAGASPPTVTSPPPPRVLVEIHLADHPSPRQVVQQNRRKPLSPLLPLDLAAGDLSRRNTAVLPLLCICLQLKDLVLEDLKVQGAICTPLDSNK